MENFPLLIIFPFRQFHYDNSSQCTMWYSLHLEYPLVLNVSTLFPRRVCVSFNRLIFPTTIFIIFSVLFKKCVSTGSID